MPLGIGEQAPNATLYSAPRTPLELEALIGERPLVLMFVPLAFSSTCTDQLCRIGEDWRPWQELDASIVAITVDSPYVNRRFAQETRAPFPILSDFNREAIRAFDVVRPDLGGLRDVAERTVFIIDRQGKVRYFWQGEHPGVMPPFEEIQAAVRDL